VLASVDGPCRHPPADATEGLVSTGRWRHRTPVLIRLVRKVDRVNGPLEVPELGICWPFLGGRTTKGHGRIRDDDGNLSYPHRIALAAALGRPLRPKMMACHRCGYQPCCRPTHLYEGSQSDNELDKWFHFRPIRGDQIIGVDTALEAIA
jgi:hypothetical protein